MLEDRIEDSMLGEAEEAYPPMSPGIGPARWGMPPTVRVGRERANLLSSLSEREPPEDERLRRLDCRILSRPIVGNSW